MYTLFDFITHIKGIEYIVAILFIAVYVLYLEVLKPRPFATLILALRDTHEHLRAMGCTKVIVNVAKIVAMPLVGLAYLLALPFFFLYAIGTAVTGRLSEKLAAGSSFGWRPGEAYFGGKKKSVTGVKGKNAPQQDGVMD
jgi:hypothetical protein